MSAVLDTLIKNKKVDESFRDFIEYRKPVERFVDPEDSNWEKYVEKADGTRRFTRKTKDQACMFLMKKGCLFDVETRPLICRLYPYYYTEKGLSYVDPFFCPITKLPPDQSILKVLDMNPNDASRWCHLLYDELREEYQRINNVKIQN